MPILSYECEGCNHNFEHFHRKVNELLTVCPNCNKPSLKSIIPKSFNFKIPGGTETMSNHGYTGKHKKLVKQRKGNKDYRDGHRSEVQQQERIGLHDYRENEKLKTAQNEFEKMREAGMKMTKEEKEAIKEEFGINKDFAKEIKKRK